MKSGVEVITGFLGAGKSAFINSYIEKTKVKDEKIVVITMEEGNEKLKKIEGVSELLINNSKNNLIESLFKAVNEYKANRILLEVNGTENLETLYKDLLSRDVSKICKLYTSYFICNGDSIESYIKNMGELLVPYIENCEVIILTNNNIIKENQLVKVEEVLGTINTKAHILSAIDKDFRETLDSSGLLEKSYVRQLRVKAMNYISKK